MSASAPVRTARVLLHGAELLVDGAPYVILGAELHNSSSSTPQAITESFDKVRSLGANTVLAPVAWQLWEPEEGSFDTSLLDAMITAARERGLRLVPLWFGSWKNASSSYVPGWVKRDADRFPRAQTAAGGRIEHLTPFSAESRDADARAFRALMGHLRDVDAERTVLMVQVENEVGLLGDSRDRGTLAEKAWHGAVPPAAVEAIADSPGMPVHRDWLAAGSRREGSWPEVLGGSLNAQEAFMAHAYAAYVGHVADAGRQLHDVPLYVNAWLDVPVELDLPAELRSQQPAREAAPEVTVAGGQEPGSYPSGGPLPRVAPIWRAAAPTLDFLAPDIYAGDATAICRDYLEASGRLFIPELRRSAVGVGLMFAAVGEYGALGVAPFGPDSFADDDPQRAALADAYRILAAATDRIRAGASRVTGFALHDQRPCANVPAAPYTLTLQVLGSLNTTADPAYGLVLREGPDQFLVLGRSFTAAFYAAQDTKVGIESVEELDFDGEWTITRRLNGDETGSGTTLRLYRPNTFSPAFLTIPFSMTSTGILRVRLYTY